ncbi:glycosyltransferase [Alteromonas pelagimontana]|uniref:Glycosyltransferase n=1 Tax=Alteromonas pelagimontana TaxID=1858656 RepID=A0A6M4MGW2_9ALTE|nr:glycosyltransferase [Alteromonas pelagimontana]QJR81840.1 glycosyltransferase [Alteromonas pelagimontana]
MYFSVVIPVYNRSKELIRALRSLARQTIKNFEVIVVDDGSVEKIAEEIRKVVSEAGELNIQLLRHDKNINGAAARNTGISKAQGEFILFLDSDDTWQESKLAKIQEAIKAYKGDKNNVVFHHPYQNFRAGKLEAAFPVVAKKEDESVAYYSFVINQIGGLQSSTLCVSASLCKRVGFDPSLKGHQDWDFCLRLEAAHAQFFFLEEALSVRYLGDNHSVAASLNWQFSLEFLRKRQRHFSKTAKVGYLQNIIARKAIYNDQSRELLLNFIALRMGILGAAMWPFWRTVIKERTRARLRYRQFIYSLSPGIKNLILWGKNNYSQKFILHASATFNVLCIIDRNAEADEKFFGVDVLAIHRVEEHTWKMCDAVVLMTDNHSGSMKKDLAQVRPEMSPFVYQY